MIKNLTLLLVLAISFSTSAQIKKGAVLLGGQLSYFRIENFDFSTTPPEQVSKSGTFFVSAGKALKDNSVLGLNLSYNPSNNYDVFFTNNGTIYNNRKLRRYSASIFYRKYKQLIGDLYFFGEGGLGYTGQHQIEYKTSPDIQVKHTINGGQLYITPGVSYNVFKKLQVELLIPNLFYTSYMHSKSDGTLFTIGTGLQRTNLGSLGVGFHFIL